MGIVDFILNLVALLLWFNWRTARFDPLAGSTPATLAGTLRRALAFAGQRASDEDIQRAVRFSDFAELKSQEVAKGFREAPSREKVQLFFRRGEADAWRDELTAAQVARIEAEHAPMMHRLGYSLAFQEPLVGAR